VTEVPLAGGDINLVVRVGETVRRPVGPKGVQALLQWYEQAGFDGAPRFLGIDEQGREVLSYVEGEPAFAPVPAGDEVVEAIGRLLRRAHDAQAGFVPPEDAAWARQEADSEGSEVIGHCDLFWTNVIFSDGVPAALIDWELARPTTRALEVALAATYWAGVRIDEQLVQWGVPLDRRGERLRLLCDAYGLDGTQRSSLLDELVEYRRGRIERGEWRGATPRDVIVANQRWVEEHRDELARFLA
jgi:aminoglycoside phosphotransferase (APT) family kinase protein